MSKVFMDTATVANCSSTLPSGAFLPSRSWVKKIAKTYTTPRRSNKAKNTERRATPMAFSITNSSGQARKSRAIRAMRVSRKSRNTRRKLGLLMAPEPIAATAIVSIQVSKTISATRTESKTNQLSFMQFLLYRNAAKRMASSTEKYTQNKFSTTMKTGCASTSVAASFESVSIAIHTELTAIMKRVTCSNKLDRAILCHTPVSL
mmetsp:Transcript_9518/g.22531  ORF Transcript_9518/g.22531 Transcript_9518/m.22531 type:complete len:205 (-) Transcript_9518:733-1347(-)